MKKNYFEFSKVIVRRSLLIFLAQMLATMAVAFFRPESSVQMVSLMNATIPLYIIIFGGYFGKAGLENYNKIKYEVAECRDNGEQQQAEPLLADENMQEV